jgi:hypothetical protein
VASEKFLRSVQSRAARLSVGVSSVRGQPKGTVEAARTFLRKSVNLHTFGRSDERIFSAALNRATDALMRSLPKPARHWGLARKLLNIFLLNCFYTTYLSKAFRLDRAEHLLELPLDSITGGCVSKAAKGRLPRWPGVKHLEPDVSARFQAEAADEAERLNIARVHLDALWWSAGRDPRLWCHDDLRCDSEKGRRNIGMNPPSVRTRWIDDAAALHDAPTRLRQPRGLAARCGRTRTLLPALRAADH